MLSDEIATAAMCLRMGLASRNPDDLRKIAEGVCNRLDLLEDEAVTWQASAIVAPLARITPPNDNGPANDGGNVTRLPWRPR